MLIFGSCAQYTGTLFLVKQLDHIWLDSYEMCGYTPIRGHRFSRLKYPC